MYLLKGQEEERRAEEIRRGEGERRNGLRIGNNLTIMSF
jgi:hypothetical protein